MPTLFVACYAVRVRVLVNFQNYKGVWNLHTLAEDCSTLVGPFRTIASDATLLRLFKYLGATDEVMAEAARDIRRWGRGSVWIDSPESRQELLGVHRPH